jgi:ribosomal protein L31
MRFRARKYRSAYSNRKYTTVSVCREAGVAYTVQIELWSPTHCVYTDHTPSQARKLAAALIAAADAAERGEGS